MTGDEFAAELEQSTTASACPKHESSPTNAPALRGRRL
jgi:hypothetical protein